MLRLLFKPLSLLSLPTLHALGALLGQITFAFMPNAKRLIIENLTQSKLVQGERKLANMQRLNIAETGKSFLESLAIWQKSEAEVLGWVRACHNWHYVDEALATGKGIIFITPHLGCFEITSIYYGASYPITALFRPPKKSWLSPLIKSGRSKGKVTMAPANTSGVRMLMQALKNNEAIGILPDQIPAAGEGEWADFFGKPAYTMLLASKIAKKTGATVIMAFGERLPEGCGFEIHLTKLNADDIATPALLNAAIEQQISACPSQYNWNYNRYKVSRKAKVMAQNSATS